jgi:tripartite-type tricarboxylate transporter receptor subunit TctC
MLVLGGLVAVFACVAPVAVAQPFPNKPIHLVIPYPAGGGTDVMARILAKRVGETIGQQVIVENKPGASGSIGAAAVARSPADGYTLLMTLSSITMNASLYKSLPYDVGADFAPVSLLAFSNYILVVNPSVDATNLPELIDLAKRNPGKLNYGSGGSGGPDHLGMELLKGMTGVDIVHVPYKGGGPGLQDTIAGNVSMIMSPTLSAVPFMKSGRVRALAGTSAKRSPAAPDVPAIGEFFPGYDVSIWYGILAPKGVPTDVLNKLNTEFRAALNHPEVAERLVGIGAEAVGNSPAEFQTVINADLRKWAEVSQRIGLRLD